jgi:hypothetical protein
MRATLPRLLKSVQRHFAFPAICCSIPHARQNARVSVVFDVSAPHTPPQFAPFLIFLQTRKFSGVLLLKNLIILDTSITVTVREILDIYPVTLHTL